MSSRKVIKYFRILFIILFFIAYAKHSRSLVLYLMIAGLLIGSFVCFAASYYTWVDHLEGRLMRNFVYPLMTAGDQWYSERTRVKKWKEKGKLKTYSLINAFFGVAFLVMAFYFYFCLY